VSLRWVFGGVGLLAALAGVALWLGTRSPVPGPLATDAAPAAIWAASFADIDGRPQSLGRFQGKIVVLNFWATWCAPCREEMPVFVRLQSRWASRDVQFVGVSSEDAERVRRFGGELAINYPLWVGGDAVSDLSRRLGNRLGVLPHTVLLDRDGRVLDSRVGAYSEEKLEAELQQITGKRT
jgi:thiol-disulfide isomerase/thioredoxin